jgi:hypothetical protein
MKSKINYLFLFAILSFFAVQTNAQTLIHFWDFNNSQPSAGGSGDSLGTAFVYANLADSTADSTYPLFPAYTLLKAENPRIVYSRPQKLFGSSLVRDSILDNGAGGALYYDYSSSNYKYFTGSDSAGGNLFIRSRNPADSCMLYLYLPTNGYKDIQLQFAISNSASTATQYNILSYSINGGTSWKNLMGVMDTFNIAKVYAPDTLLMTNSITNTSAWYPVQINFSADTSINSNPKFVLRFMMAGSYSVGTKHNDRYDNFAVWGTPITSGINEIQAQNAGYNLYPNPAGDVVTLSSDKYAGVKLIKVYSVVGELLSTIQDEKKSTQLNISSLAPGVYFTEISELSSGNVYTMKFIKN